MPSAIIFNGPPGSGKDEAANAICSVHANATRLEFKSHLIDLTTMIYGVNKDWFLSVHNQREMKEQSMQALRGLSTRQALIYVSEEVIKPKFGKDYFGRFVADRMTKDLTYVFSDGGFVEEVAPVHEKCNGKFLIVHLHRDGCDWSNDSRSYIHSLPGVDDIHTIHMDNNGTKLDFMKSVVQLFDTQNKTWNP